MRLLALVLLTLALILATAAGAQQQTPAPPSCEANLAAARHYATLLKDRADHYERQAAMLAAQLEAARAELTAAKKAEP